MDETLEQDQSGKFVVDDDEKKLSDTKDILAALELYRDELGNTKKRKRVKVLIEEYKDLVIQATMALEEAEEMQ